MILVLDTTFFALHYFSRDTNVLLKTKEIIRVTRKLGNRGLVPTIVLAEFYALTRKSAGRDRAEKYLSEIEKSGLEIVPLTSPMARQAGRLRAKHQERIPWGDCIIAGTAMERGADYVITEDPHFAQIKETRARSTLKAPA